MSPGSAIFGELVQIDDADLRVLGRFFELLEQAIDGFEFFLDFNCLRHGHRRAAGEIVLRGQFVDFVLVAEAVDQFHQLTGERRIVVSMGVPDAFQIADLLFFEGAAKTIAEVFGRRDLLASCAIIVSGCFSGSVGLVGLQDFAFSLFAARL